MKELFKRQNGITLIALIITIIVLLILAGISIKAVVGENGIIGEANNAKNAAKASELEEKIKLATIYAIDKRGDIDQDKFAEKIEELGGTVSRGDYPIIVQIDGESFFVDKEGNVEKIEADGIVTVTFCNYDGTVLQTLNVKKGGGVQYTGTTPTRPEEGAYTYTFDKWVTTQGGSTEANLSNIQSNMKVYASYIQTTTTFTVTFCNYDGSVLQNVKVKRGETATYTGATPTRPKDGTYKYTFNTWVTTKGGSTKANLTNVQSNFTVYADYNAETSGGGWGSRRTGL